MDQENFHEQLKNEADQLVKKVYRYTRQFPKDEIFGVTSQLRRAALSVALNYIEGYARQRKAVFKNFVEIAYGSLKETEYLIELSSNEKYITDEQSKELLKSCNRIAAMLYGILKRL